jgi:CDP-diacylglycerol---serine O-phosphatidyltransferase
MKPEGKMFNIPNLLTAGNLLCGIFCILSVLMGKFEYAPWFIFLGAFFDFLDGFAARMFKQYSELGKQLDSLADMVTFGLAPGIIMMAVIAASIEMGVFPEGQNLSEHMVYVLNMWQLGLFYDSSLQFSGIYKYLPFVGLLIPVFSMFRLAKFNIDTRQSESFIGMPTPAVTLFFTTFPLALWWHFSTCSNLWPRFADVG